MRTQQRERLVNDDWQLNVFIIDVNPFAMHAVGI
jgi:hypothetical protein